MLWLKGENKQLKVAGSFGHPVDAVDSLSLDWVSDGTVLPKYQMGPTSTAYLPLEIRDSALGVLQLKYPQAETWPDEQRDFLIAFSRLAALALDRAMLLDDKSSTQSAAHQAENQNRAVVEKYQRQTRLFEQIASSTPDFIYLFDTTGRIIYANRRLLEVWGRTYDQTIGKTLYELGYEQWHADMHMQEIRQVMQTRKAIKGEVPFTGGSGISGVYEYIFTPVLDPEGNVEVIAGTTRDVTERKSAEQHMARDAKLLANVRDSVIVTDLQGVVTFWNSGATRLLGWTADEMLGKNYIGQLPEPIREQTTQRFNQMLSSGEEVTGEWLAYRKDGSRIWIAATVRQIRDPAGNSLGIMGVSRDISERKRTDAERESLLASEQAARAQASQAQMRLIGAFQGSPAFMALMSGPDHVYEFVNDALYTLVGHRQLVGKSVASALPEMEGQIYVNLLNNVYTTGEPFIGRDMPAMLQRQPDGPLEQRFVDFAFQPLRDADGTISGVFLHGVDTTDRLINERALRESEARFRQLANAMPQIVWAATPQGVLDYYNHRWFEFIGVPEENAGTASQWTQHVHPEDLPRVAQEWNVSVQSGSAYRTEFRVRGADADYLWFLVRAEAVRDQTGAITRWFGTCTDITDRKASEQDRQRLLETERVARADAEHASRMKDEFLATLSHELRTPLNAILGWATILTSHKPDEQDLRDGLDTIQRNARAQTQIIEDLLDMSRIISGKVRLVVQRVDIAGVLQASMDTMKPAADAKGVRLVSVLDPHAGPVSGDPNRLQQVFWNLLNNAVKFTPKTGQVQLLLERVNSHIEITVSDTGEGIKPEFLPHVFDRFRQADASITRRHGGLGLGLAIVKQLVELHGGTVRVKSPGVGKGTTFTVALPLTVIHPDDAKDTVDRRHPAAGNAVTDTAIESEKLTGLRILVVDDEPDARALVKRLLQDCDAVVEMAGSVNEALVMIAKMKPDVLVSDIGMPEEDGYSLIRKVRELPADRGGDVPAVALTAYARTEDRIHALRAGFQAHISKPVDATELITVIASLKRRKSG